MNRILLYLTVVILLLEVAFVACTPEISTLPSSIVLDPSSLTLAPGESLKLSAEVLPGEATIKTLIWDSNNPAVATVDDGVVTAITEGNALITVTTKSGQKMATCMVRVAWPVDRVVLDNSTVILTVGKSQRLTATVIPNNAPDKSLKWESSNPGIVEVVDGVLIAKALGTATVTVTTEVGSRKATCSVRVVRDKHIFLTGSLTSMIVSFSVAGSGTIDIIWGDNSEIETFTLSETLKSYNHHYTGKPPFTITIEGENVTFFGSSVNQLTDLGFSNMTEITKINCAYNNLTSLDMSGCTALEELTCNNNPLTSLNVSNTRLKSLNVSEFFTIEHLVVENNVNLTVLNCSNNLIKNLDLSGNIALTTLNCSNNQLTNLDVANNIALESLDCSMNRLSTEALNDLFRTLHGNTVTGEKTVRILGNPGLFSCDQSIATDKGWDIVLGSYMTMTMTPQGGVSISFFGRGAVAIDWGDGSTENYTLEQGIWNWSFYNHYYNDNQPHTAIIAGDIEGLTVNNIILKHLDVSNNPGLKILNCNNNQLTSLDVSKNTMLEILTCEENQFTNLDVSNNDLLTILNCSGNQFTNLDVSNNDLLTNLYCSGNLLTNLDVGNLKALAILNCEKNQFSAAELNALFGTLHNNYVNGGYKWIYMNDNPGSNACDRSIATRKGWIFN